MHQEHEKNNKNWKLYTLHFFSCSTLTWHWDIVLDTLYSVGLLQMRDQPDAETSTWQHTTLTRENHTPRRIRTHNPSKQVAAVPHLRLHTSANIHNQQTKHHLKMCANHSSSTLYKVEKNASCEDHIHTIFHDPASATKLFLRFSSNSAQRSLRKCCWSSFIFVKISAVEGTFYLKVNFIVFYTFIKQFQ